MAFPIDCPEEVETRALALFAASIGMEMGDPLAPDAVFFARWKSLGRDDRERWRSRARSKAGQA
jgi:hypothetical protein